jgi:hypothetical protein
MHCDHRPQRALRRLLYQLSTSILIAMGTVPTLAQAPDAAVPASQAYGDAADCEGNDANAPQYSKNFFDEIGSKWTDYRMRAEQLYRLDKGLRCLSYRLLQLQTRPMPDAVGTNSSEHIEIKTELSALTMALGAVRQEWKTTVESCSDRPRGKVKDPANQCDDASRQALAEIAAHIRANTDALRTLTESLGKPNGKAAGITFVSQVETRAEREGPPDDRAPTQIRPDKAIADYFVDEAHNRSIEFAVATIPDPRVPRHRRAYDNSIAAITLGMLRAHFVVDRYVFPWQEDLKNKERSSDSAQNIVEDARYGLIIFRRDAWRNAAAAAGTRVRVLYLIAETATYGVQQEALKAAIGKIQKQLGERIDLARFNVKGFQCTGGPDELVVFGPAFSGSLDSLRNVALQLPIGSTPAMPSPVIRTLCLVSSATTAASNQQVDKTQGAPIKYVRLAIADDDKIDAIEQLSSLLDVAPQRVAFVYESSLFGLDFCNAARAQGRSLCRNARRVGVPVNIADIRYGVREKTAERRKSEKSPIPIADTDDHLSLQEGAENGSEFPESDQSPLTAVTSQLNLDTALDEITGQHARIVVVIATDVRDRLFLLEQIRRRLPHALMVDLETDRLLAHPDFIHASRGAVTLASGELTRCTSVDGGNAECNSSAAHTQFDAWATDNQALLGDAIASWSPPSCDPQPCSPSAPQFAQRGKKISLHVVTRAGLKSSRDTRHEWLELGQWAMKVLPFILIASLAAMLTWLHRNRLLGLAVDFEFLRPPRTHVLTAVILLAVLVPVFLGANALYPGPWFASAAVFVAATLLFVRREVHAYGIRWAAQVCVALTILVTSAEIGHAITTIGSTVRKYGPDVKDQDLLGNLTPFLAQLSGGIGTGLGYAAVVGTALVALLFVFLVCGRGIAELARSQDTLSEAANGSKGNGQALAALLIGPQGRAWTLFLATAAAVLLVEASSLLRHDGLRLSLFGEWADICVWLALLAVTLLALMMLCVSIGMAGRIRALTRFVLSCVLSRAAAKSDRENPLLWEKIDEDTPAFARTAIVISGNAAALDKSTPDLLRELLYGHERGPRQMTALFALLASEVSLYVWTVAAGVVAGLSGALITYFFPVTNGDGLLLVNLAILLAAGLHFGYTTVSFESDAVLSNVLCNAKRESKWSFGLFSYVAFPFVALALAVAIAQAPGVMSWSGGLFDLLMEAVKPGILK